MMIQQKSGNIPARSPLQLLGSRLLHLFLTEKSALQTFFSSTNLLPLYTYSKSLSSMSLFQTILSCAFLFSVLFLFSLYSYQPLKTQSAQENPLSFLLFPFIFQKSECSSPLMQDFLVPYVCNHINSFFLTKYFSYLFQCTYLSES